MTIQMVSKGQIQTYPTSASLRWIKSHERSELGFNPMERSEMALNPDPASLRGLYQVSQFKLFCLMCSSEFNRPKQQVIFGE